MLTTNSPIGKIAALPSQEREIAGMSDAEFCAELNRRPCNQFMIAAWLRGDRNDVIAFDGFSTFTLKAEIERLEAGR
jgi:hypothetical protein